jgi:hypothetical protein
MKSKSYCNPDRQPPATSWPRILGSCAGWCAALLAPFVLTPAARANADAPAWMHAQVSAPVPAHDERTDAALLYSEHIVEVQDKGKMKTTERRVYKILRPGGRGYGLVLRYYDSETKINGMRGWCIPTQGKDYEVKDKDAIDAGLTNIENGILFSDERERMIKIPAADPGNIIGYEIEQQERPYVLQEQWAFQSEAPAREMHFVLQLPAGWEYRAVWINHPEVPPVQAAPNRWEWVVKDVPGIRQEPDMPPWRGGQMVLSLLPPGNPDNKGFIQWGEVAAWENTLARDRRDPSPEIKQKVAELTASRATKLDKMRAIAQFLQQDIRYVAIELGIGGWQPHPAPEIFTHRFGDCKDKATLMSSMLKEIGVDSYYVTINTERGGVNPQSPPTRFWFDHQILAIKLPDDVKDTSVAATIIDSQLGRLLIFDPTDEMTPFGQIRGALQGDYGLLVKPEGGELIQCPILAPRMTGVTRSAKFTLDAGGTLRGEVHEMRTGDQARYQRWAQRTVSTDSERIKPIESLLANSLATFYITKATVYNAKQIELPFGFDYAILAPDYAKRAGGLLLVRPRVIGTKSSDLLETKEPRKFPVEMPSPEHDTDTFEIALPAGYAVDDMPSPVDVDYPFGSYHSKTEVQGNVLRYSRTFEMKELSVPLSQMGDLKKFYRIIAGDERETAILKPSGQ